MKNNHNDPQQLFKEIDLLRKRVKELEESRFLKKIGDLAIERQELMAILDSIDEVIYVADPATYEMLYANAAVVRRFGPVVGKQCHKALQNLDEPCSFCSNKYIFGKNAGKTYSWEWQNLRDNRWYWCIDRAIKWPGERLVRFEIAINITELKKREEALRQKAERLEKMAVSVSGLQKEVNELLATLGRKKKYPTGRS